MKIFTSIWMALSMSFFGISYAAESAKTKAAQKHEHEHEGEEKHGEHAESGHDESATHAHDEHDKEGEEKHAHEENGKDEHAHDEHGDEGHAEHGEEGGHGHEEGNSRIGPEKGILTASENEGIKLSPEAIKNFELETKALSGQGPWTIPISARLLAGEEVNLFRVRDESYKRIDFILVKRNGDQITVNSKDLRSGDSIVIKGIGFLRIAEITAFGGAPEGHSH